MITITAQVEIQCLTDVEMDDARAKVAQMNLTDAPVVDEVRRLITFNLIQIVESLG